MGEQFARERVKRLLHRWDLRGLRINDAQAKAAVDVLKTPGGRRATDIEKAQRICNLAAHCGGGNRPSRRREEWEVGGGRWEVRGERSDTHDSTKCDLQRRQIVLGGCSYSYCAVQPMGRAGKCMSPRRCPAFGNVRRGCNSSRLYLRRVATRRLPHRVRARIAGALSQWTRRGATSSRQQAAGSK